MFLLILSLPLSATLWLFFCLLASGLLVGCASVALASVDQWDGEVTFASNLPSPRPVHVTVLIGRLGIIRWAHSARRKEFIILLIFLLF